MDVRMLVIDLAEKISLLATAALAAVLFPPLRNRLLGFGQPADRVVACLFGVFISMWGAKMLEPWLGYTINVRAIGVLLGGVLGGSRVGMVTGLLAGLFYVFRVNPDVGVAQVAVSFTEGALAGLLVERAPQSFHRWRAFGSSLLVQAVGVVILGLFSLGTGTLGAFAYALPAIGLELLTNASAVTFFGFVTLVILGREENAVALADARAAADTLALDSLRRKLEPHFLFNALNTVRATIRTNPILARDLVADLADLYRYLLHHPDDATLASEVSHASAYLGIESARLGPGRLTVRTQIPPELTEQRVPALLLQPLVENAVKHGIATRDKGGEIRVGAHSEGEVLIIEVEDIGQGELVGPAERGQGIALETLRLQLSHRFGAAASIVLDRGAEGTTARVCLPMTPAQPSIEAKVDR